ncbi:MAG: CoA pyrophosphatase [candidate division WOR-3 bacterium]
MPRVKKAAVCIMFKDLSVLLIKRSENLSQHAGEIGFPGGMVKIGESPLNALLREIEEELGLKPVDYSIVGELKPVKTAVTNIKVYPYVATISHEIIIKPSNEIVAWDFIPLIDLRPLVYTDFVETRLGTVWGATARIIRNLFKEGRKFLPEIFSIIPE